MIYLVLQMALYLVLASLAGLVIGWWINQLRNGSKKEETASYVMDDDDFAIKHRLDQCFDDNAQLRRDLKLSNEQLEKHLKQGNSEGVGQGENLTEKIQVLMDDLQIRDDTILALEKELEKNRNND